MALSSMSRSYLGSVAGRPGLGLRVPSVVGLASGSRTYAASAQKKAPAAKGTSKAGAAKRGATKPAAPAAPMSAADRQKSMAAQQALMSEEEKLKEIERLLATNHLVPMVDPWGQQIEDTLDVMIPHDIKWSNPVKAFKLWKENMSNTFKNYAALKSLVDVNSVPDVYLPYNIGIMERLNRQFQAFGTRSTKPDALLSPFRESSLESYQKMNAAVASRDDKEILKWTTYAYHKQSLELAKTLKSKYRDAKAIWELRREVNPTQVLSLRITEGYLAPENPRFGNRLLVHALVKFDTEQTLELYNRSGTPLHTVDDQSSLKLPSGRVPAKPKRVTEYLVLEKRMWQQGPWRFREQVWPRVKGA